MHAVVSNIYFIKSLALKHCQFKEFLEECESEYGDLVYFSVVCWLKLKSDNWICDLVFLMDITTHLNDLNLKLQKQNQLIHEMYSHVKAFQTKLQIWENQLRTGDAFHFPTLAIHGSTSRYDFAVELNELKKELNTRFNDFKARKADFNLFRKPFNADVEKVLKKLQMDLIEFQSDEFLQQKFKEESLMHFYETA
uniref:General transcription factor II-I repeat domain-containing protein 2 n=1 Tax=Octopus bimaculoides TaxID=37653 RepID=A0A0L8FJE7_OCTBM